MKIAIIGATDAILGFRAVGVEAIGVQTTQEAEQALHRVYTSGEHAAVFITEDWYDRIRDYVLQLPPQALPAIVAVPSQEGSTGAGLRSLKRVIEQAVGSDIFDR